MAHHTQPNGSFLVERSARGSQTHPEVAPFARGFVVAWTDDPVPPCEVGGPDVKARVFDVAGAPTCGQFVVNGETINHQFGPKIADLSDGGFVLLWQDFSGRGGDPCSGGIKARVFGSDGTAAGREFLVNLETADQQICPVVASLGNGGFVVAWQDRNRTQGEDGSVRARTFSAQGVPLGDDFVVSAHVHNHRGGPAIAGLPSDAFVVTWCSSSGSQGAGSRMLKGRVFGTDGRARCEEFTVATGTNDDVPVVAAIPGGFVIVWSHAGSTENTCVLKARLYDLDGNAGSEETTVLEAGPEKPRPRVLAFKNGFAVAWREAVAAKESSSIIRLKYFDLGCIPLGEELVVDLNCSGGELGFGAAVLSKGTVVLVWEDREATTGCVVTKAKVLKAPTPTPFTRHRYETACGPQIGASVQNPQKASLESRGGSARTDVSVR